MSSYQSNWLFQLVVNFPPLSFWTMRGQLLFSLVFDYFSIMYVSDPLGRQICSSLTFLLALCFEKLAPLSIQRFRSLWYPNRMLKLTEDRRNCQPLLLTRSNFVFGDSWLEQNWFYIEGVSKWQFARASVNLLHNIKMQCVY